MNASIMLKSGGVVTIRDGVPDVSEVDIGTDILDAYHNITRFSGQVLWTDYDHINFGIHVLGVDHPLVPYWILHEAGEALGIGDVNFRLKPPALRSMDERLIDAVCEHADVPLPTDDLYIDFKDLDLNVGCFEASELFSASAFDRTCKFYDIDPESIRSLPWRDKMYAGKYNLEALLK